MVFRRQKMAKLNDGEKLRFPIEFYSLKRNFVYVFILLLFVNGVLIFDLILPLPSHRGQLPFLVKIIFLLCCSYSLRLMFLAIKNPHPLLAILRDRVVVYGLGENPNSTYYFSKIKDIHFSFGKMPRMAIEEKSEKIFGEKKLLAISNVRLNDTLINSRELANVVQQVVDNAKNNSNNPIIYQKVKLKFLDWY